VDDLDDFVPTLEFSSTRDETIKVDVIVDSFENGVTEAYVCFLHGEKK